MNYVSKSFLQRRAEMSMELGFSKQKWIVFCEYFMDKGFKISMYEARRTVSKYITIHFGEQEFKVRFSNHKPIYNREVKGDCDFFVGRTHTGVRTTDDAIRAVEKWINGIKAIPDLSASANQG